MISRENIEAIYPLDDKLKGLAFFSLQNTDSDPGYIQLKFSIKGPLEKKAYQAAWSELIKRHQSMRLSLQSPNNKEPMLVALKKCMLAIEWIDVRGMPESKQQLSMDQTLERNYTEGFNLSMAPVHRLVGVQTDDNLIVFLWSCHHLFLDGWSAIVLLNDLAQLYAEQRGDTFIDRLAKNNYGDYLQWVKSQPVESGRSYWTHALHDFQQASLISPVFYNSSATLKLRHNQVQEYSVFLDETTSALIEATALNLKVTTASIVYAVWSLYLSLITGKLDLVFGTTTAGRSFDLTDSDIMTGYFANVLPKRYVLDTDETIEDMIKRCHKDGFSALPFEYLSLKDIRACCTLDSACELFDHLVLFENLPQDDIILGDPAGHISMGDFSGGLTSVYPLTLTIMPGEKWRFKFIYRSLKSDAETERLLSIFPTLMSSVCNTMHYSIGTVLDDWALEPGKSKSDSPLFQKDSSELSRPAITARSRTELKVSKVWEEILASTEPIDVDAEFMSVGGTSLNALKVISSLEEQTAYRVTLLDFVRNPTIASLSTLIDGEKTTPPWRSLIPLKVTGKKPPVIFVNAVGAHAMFLQSIVQYFEVDRPIFGLQLPALDGQSPPLETIDEIAQLYLEEITSAVPNGPYHFVAVCLGGVVTFEIVQKLKRMNKEVGRFIVLDNIPPLTQSVDSYTTKLRQMVKEPQSQSVVKKYSELLIHVIKHLWYRAGQLCLKIKQRFILKYGSTHQKNQVYLELAHAASHKGYWSYFATPVEHNIILISSAWDTNPEHARWADLAQELKQLTLPIGHVTMFTEPEVSILGKELNSLINSEESESKTN